MMDDFQAILLEGVFSSTPAPTPATLEGFDPSSITVDGKSLVETLEPLIGTRVQFAMHHFPPRHIDPSLWGGGCCFWQPMGWCPAGHHLDPGIILNVSMEGVLRRDGTAWSLEKFDGSKQALPFAFLVGHQARVAAASIVDVEKMREALMSQVAAGDLGQVEGLGTQMGHLKEILAKLKEFKG